MASKTLTPYQYKHYNSGWSSWSSNLYGGYSGSTKYAVVLRYKVSDIDYFNPPYEITLEVPWVRQTTSAESGKFTIYLFTSDPTSSNTPSTIENSTSPKKRDTTTKSWSETDHELHVSTGIKLTYNPSSATTATYFYVWIANSVDFLEIGHKGYSDANDYQMKIAYNSGAVKIYDGSSWINATPYVYDGSSWVRTTAYVYNGSKWIAAGSS